MTISSRFRILIPVLILALGVLAAASAPARENNLAPSTRDILDALAAASISVTATDSLYEDHVEIFWPLPGDFDVFFRVYRILDASTDTTLLTVLSSEDSSYVDTGGDPGVDYRYAVHLVDVAADTVLDMGHDFGSRRINPPGNLRASDGTLSTRVRILWSDLSFVEAGYRIYRRDSGVGSFVEIGTTAANEEVYDDETAVQGDMYDYRVAAFDADDFESRYRQDTGWAGYVVPPGEVDATDGIFTDRVRVTWADQSPDETGFRIYRNGNLIDSVGVDVTVYDDTDSLGVLHDYAVAAVVDTGGTVLESVYIHDDGIGGPQTLTGTTALDASDDEFDDKVVLNWVDEADYEDAWKVERNSVLIATLDPDTETFEDIDAQPGVQYTYGIYAAADSGGTSTIITDTGRRAVILAPQNVNATDGTNEAFVEITWESDATSVILFKILRDGTAFKTVNGTVRSAIDTDVVSGAVHTYCVVAVTAFEDQSPSGCDDGYRELKAPTEAAASDDAYEDRVLITWKDNSKVETGYNIYRRLSGVGSYTLLGTRGAGRTAYVDTAAVPGTVYDYEVAAGDALGESVRNGDSGSRILAAPTYVEATDGAFETQVELEWLDNSRFETGYMVYRRTAGSTSDPDSIADLAANAMAYTDTQMSFGVDYEYFVVPYDDLGISEGSEGTDTGFTNILPPLSVSASDGYSNNIVVTWVDQSMIETGYRVQRRVLGSSDSFVTRTTTSAGVESYTDNGGTEGVEYEYCVTTISGSVESETDCDTGYFQNTTSFYATKDVDTYLELDGLAASDRYGVSVAMDGDQAIVGARNRDTDGKIIFFERGDNGWVKTTEFGPPETSVNTFGNKVDMYGDYAVATANGGRTYVYEHTTNGWVYYGKASTTFRFAQYSVALGDGVLAMTNLVQLNAQGNNQRALWIVPITGDGNFGDDTFINDPIENPATKFGDAMAFRNGNELYVGAPGLAGTQTRSFIYFYYKDSNGDWPTGSSYSSFLQGGDETFGAAIDIKGNKLLVGEPKTRSAYIYNDAETGSFSDINFLAAPTTAYFGASVAIWENYALVGAPHGDSTGAPSGSAYLFQQSPDGSWSTYGGLELIPTRAADRDDWGRSVAMDNGSLLFGGQRNDTFGSDAGSVVSFDISMAPDNVTASDAAYDDRIQVKWDDNSTAETQEDGFNVYRDGVLIETTAANIRTYNDFEAQPGRAYKYEVTSVRGGAETDPDSDYGRRAPNGSITGRVETQAGAPVTGVEVFLDPTPNGAMLFDGYAGYASSLPVEIPGDFTLEFWANSGDMSTLGNYIEFRDNSEARFYVGNTGTLVFAASYEAGGTNPVTEEAQTSIGLPNDTWIHWAFVVDQGTDIIAYKDGAPYDTLDIEAEVQGTRTVRFGGFKGRLDDVRIWGTQRSTTQIADNMGRPLTGDEDGLIAYWKMDEGIGTLAADDAPGEFYAALTPGAHWSLGAPLTASATSDLEGNYVHRELRYGSSTTFKVIPQLANRVFEPGFKTITLATDTPVQNEVAFRDISSYTMSGYVRLANVILDDDAFCFAPNVEIKVDGETKGVTDGNGNFSIALTIGEHTIEPSLGDHTFSPSELTVNVSADTSGVEFVDTTLRSMSGLIGGGCGLDIGDLEIEIVSENGCFSKEDYSGSGNYEIQLPPQTYFVTVRDVQNIPAGLDKADVLEFFDQLGTREINLADADTVLDFVYRAPIKVRVTGFDAPACNVPPLNVPVLAQGDQVALTIEVYEDYGNGNECPVDSASVTIYDEIIDEADTPSVVEVENGVASYTTIANTPNVFAGRRDANGVDRSYQKPITAVADVGGIFATKIEWVIVTGQRPRIPTFTSVTDVIPILILRDPPGDNSFAFLEQGTSTCTEVQNLGMENLETKFSFGIKTGIKFEKGSPFWSTETETAVEASDAFTIGIEANEGDGLTICATTNETFSTSSDEIFVGANGDVYLGVALNLVFAKTDVVEFDDQACQIIKSEAITVGGDGLDPFETTYLYTGDHIQNVVIPQLRDIAVHSSDPGDVEYYDSSADYWESILDYNAELKADAEFVENRSFSAGADYSASASTDTTDSFTWSIKAYTGYEGSAAFEFEESGTGSKNSFGIGLNFAYTRVEGSSTTNTRTVGYTLSDDDIGDFFSVNISEDADYGTPVFDVVSGTSSCPWEPWYNDMGEPKMQPRDSAVLAVEPPELRAVPPTETATFTLSLSNDSQSGESREYILRPIQTSNPGGAILAANGTGFAGGLSFFIEPQTTQEVTFTVKRGPRKYLYENIQLQLVSPCEYSRWQNGGPLQLADTVSVTVEFEAPCSEVNLFRPLSGWTHNAADGDTLEVILNDYEFKISEDDSIQAVGAQYRLLNTDIWYPIEEIARVNLPTDAEGEPQSVSIFWDISNVAQEGKYEIRGYSRCEAGSNYSTPATGLLDRTPPTPFGAPAPADSVLSLGEEIKITFGESILCESVNAANVTLVRVNSDQSTTPVQTDVRCSGSSIIITPVSPTLANLEGKTLIASVTGVRDLAGNVMEARNASSTETWRFQVRRSAFTWAQGTLAREVPYRNPGSVGATLVNGTAGSLNFQIIDNAEWLTPDPVGETLLSQESMVVFFDVADTLSLGTHRDTLRAVVYDQNTQIVRETPLFVELEVVCVPPVWELNPADFEQTMTVVAQVSMGGQLSVDPNDRIAAFVGNQLRGVASPKLVTGLGDYMVFLTVYSNRSSGESVRFQMYDESECRLYPASDRTFAFVADGSVGTPAVPELIIAQDLPSATVNLITVNEGWTWLSFNLRGQDMSVDGVLGDLNPDEGDLLKAQTAFSQFDPDLGWVGNVSTFDNRYGYALSLSDAGTISLDGSPVPPDSTAIPLANGWNWIGYTPQSSMNVNQALADISPQDNDVIKGQYGFAQYLAVNNNTKGWYGNLETMEPGRGYKLKLRNATNSGNSFMYPVPVTAAAAKPTALGGLRFMSELPATVSDWELDPRAYQYNMTVTAAVNMDGAPVVGTSLVLAAFSGDEIRGVADLQQIPGLNGARAFLMVYGNSTEGEEITLRVYNPATDQILEVEEMVAFQPDAVVGDLREPFVASTSMDAVWRGDVHAFRLLRMHPNPLSAGAAGAIRFSIPADEHVSIRVFDLQGRMVRTLVDERLPAGDYEEPFDTGNLPAGVYFYRLTAGPYSDNGRVVLLK